MRGEGIQDRLTKREKEALDALMSAGWNLQQAALVLDITDKTMSVHMTRICDKYHLVPGNGRLARLAYLVGLIQVKENNEFLDR